MEDKGLADKGKALIKQYGCAGCHEIRGFEEEQRIGKELTAEGATPLERLDFALMTHKAQLGEEPNATSDAGGATTSESGGSSGDSSVATKGPSKKAPTPWYDHKGFFEPKLEDPGACHNVQVGQKSVLSRLPQYQQNGTLGAVSLGPEQLPPGLMTEGARVDPDWLLRFLCDPSLSNASEQCRTLGGQPAAAGTSGGAQPQPNVGRGDTANRQSAPAVRAAPARSRR